MKEKISRLKSLVLLSLPAIAAIAFTGVLQWTVLSQPEKFTNWLASFGPFVALVYIAIQSITLIIPPLGGAFIWIGMIAVLGPEKGLLLSYFVTTPLYCVNFLLSKKYGQPLVKKVVGGAGMTKIDKYAKEAGLRTLLFLKIFENGYFDYISYAAGLTNIRFKDFLIINIFGGIPSTLLTYLILIWSPDFVTSIILVQLMAAILIGISFVIHRIRLKLKNDLEKRI